MFDLDTTNVLKVMSFLFPGFVAAWVYYGLTSFPKPSQFERVIQAFIFTMVVQVFVYSAECSIGFFNDGPTMLDDLPEKKRVLLSVLAAFFVGVVFASFANNDKFHSLMRWLRLSKEASYPSEWFSSFANSKSYVVLHLDGHRRLYGWPTEWPSDPEKGHFAIAEAEWLPDNEKEKPIVLHGVLKILVPASEVEFVEFMEPAQRSTK